MKIFISLCLLFSLIGGFVLSAEAQNGKTYLGYKIAKTVRSKDKTSTVVIRKGRKILARHNEGFGNYRASEFEFLPILGQKDKQLVITQFTGGAHCCRRYWVYDLKPSFRLIFQSKDFNIGDGGDNGEGRFQNIDNDKELELIDRNDAFLYFDDLAYVSSPKPILVFDYNRKRGRFQLANKKFASYILKDENVWIERARKVRDENNLSQHSVDIFSILLDYIYAGKESQGWEFYKAEKAAEEKVYVHDTDKIKEVLAKDKAYKSIYKR